MSMMNEGLRVVKAISLDPFLSPALEQSGTAHYWRQLEPHLHTAGMEAGPGPTRAFKRVRDNVGAHYDTEEIKKAIKRLAKQPDIDHRGKVIVPSGSTNEWFFIAADNVVAYVMLTHAFELEGTWDELETSARETTAVSDRLSEALGNVLVKSITFIGNRDKLFKKDPPQMLPTIGT